MGRTWLRQLLAARSSERLLRQATERFQDCDADAAERLFRQALEEAERSRQARPIAQAAQFLYFLLRRQHRYEEAAAVLERKLAAQRRLDGPDGRWVAEWRNELIWLYGRLTRPERLLTLCRERLESDIRRNGTASFEAALAHVTLAWALRLGGRWEESEACCRKALASIEATCGFDHPRTGWALIGLALTLQHRGRFEEAEASLLRARDNWERVGHADRVATVHELLIDLYVAQRRERDAYQLSSTWLERVEPRSSISDDRRLERVICHAGILRALDRNAEAERLDARADELRRAIAARRDERAAPRPRREAHPEPDTPRSSSPSDGWVAGPLFPSPLL